MATGRVIKQRNALRKDGYARPAKLQPAAVQSMSFGLSKNATFSSQRRLTRQAAAAKPLLHSALRILNSALRILLQSRG